MAEPRKLTPAEEARLAQVREQFKQKQANSSMICFFFAQIEI